MIWLSKAMSDRGIIVDVLGDDSALLGQVIALADRNTKWLGFFPKEAWRASATAGQVLVALERSGHSLCGYLLYNVARGRAVVQQLCVEESQRKRGVARKLVDELKSRTRHLDGISLHCAREFSSHDFWPKVWFVYLGEKLGRGKKPRVLSRFWFDHRHPSLITHEPCGSIVAVLDANIFFGLTSDRINATPDVLALEDDWLLDEVDLRISEETFNEISRKEDENKRNESCAAARSFPQIGTDPARVDTVMVALHSLFAKTRTASDESDVRQLAHAITADVAFFVTRDMELVKQSPELLERFGLRVVSPIELITHLDQLRRELEYAPGRLAGSCVEWGRVGSAEIGTLHKTYLANGLGESRSQFDSRVGAGIGSGSHDVIQVKARDEPMALLVTNRSSNCVMNVPCLRARSHRLAPTVVRHLLARTALTMGKDYEFVELRDEHSGQVTDDACSELGFVRDNGSWLKLNLRGCWRPAELADVLENMRKAHAEHDRLLGKLCGLVERAGDPSVTAQELLAVEKLLFPTKLADERLPNFVVPIQPRWARHLFDEELSSEYLLEADEAVALRCENVYYRSASVPVVSAPGHTLWYVTEDSDSRRVRQIRACSSVSEIVIGEPKGVFQRFRRLGIYDWKNVSAAAGRKNGNVLAILFGLTERFKRPMSRRTFEKIVRQQGRKVPPLSNPYEISCDCFKEIHGTCSQ